MPQRLERMATTVTLVAVGALAAAILIVWQLDAMRGR